MKLKRTTIVAACLALCACQAVEPLQAQPNGLSHRAGFTQTGVASWYGKAHQGRKTANGERFNRFDETAAHPSLPFNTIVRVTTLDTGKSTLVRINDRGPGVRGRIIDLSDAAAQSLGIREEGLAKVRIEIVDASP